MSLISSYSIVIDKQGLKDLENIKQAGLKKKVDVLLRKIELNPFCNPPPYEKLKGDLSGAYSRRINRTHRLIYKTDKQEKIVTIIRMWTHYDKAFTKV